MTATRLVTKTGDLVMLGLPVRTAFMVACSLIAHAPQARALAERLLGL